MARRKVITTPTEFPKLGANETKELLSGQDKEQIVRRILNDPAIVKQISQILPSIITPLVAQSSGYGGVGERYSREDHVHPLDTTSRPPSGAAGGDLAGTYPNPDIGSGVIVNADVNAAAAIAYSKLALSNSIVTGDIVDGTITDSDVNAANKDGVAGTASMRTLGTGAQQACGGTDSRLSDSRAPNGSASGDLTGTYPSPTIKNDVGLGGNPTTTTQAVDNSSTKIATTAYVVGQAAAASPVDAVSSAGSAVVGTSTRYARADHVHKIGAGVIVNADISDTAAIEGRKLGWHVGTSPPGSPSDGDLWLYTGSNFYWLLVYDSSETTYKWKFIGGGSIVANVVTDETFTDNSTNQDAATAGPTVTLPRAGDYEVEFTANMYYASQAAARGMYTTCTASSGTFDSDASTNSNAMIQTSGGVAETTSNTDVIRGASASATLKLQYSGVADTGTAHTRWRQVKARPIRII